MANKKTPEPRGVGSERTESLRTKTGLVLYYRGKDEWEVDYPKDQWTGENKRYGGATTIKVMNLIYHLAQGKSIPEADKLAFG